MLLLLIIIYVIRCWFVYDCVNFYLCRASVENSVNPILTGLFESKFLLGGGSIWPPLQISAPKGPIAAKFCMDVKTHLKNIATEKKIAENGLFIILL